MEAFEEITLEQESEKSDTLKILYPLIHAVNKPSPTMEYISETVIESAHISLCPFLEGRKGKTHTTRRRFLRDFVDQTMVLKMLRSAGEIPKENILRALLSFAFQW